MALQYTGTNVNTTFTTTTGTRQEVCSGLEDALNGAGWTTISGHHTATILLESATTPSPQSLLCRVQLTDPGSGNCAIAKFRNASNTRSQSGGLFLLPAAGKVFRVVANPYQFFCFTAGSPTTPREFICGGVPYLPSHLQGVITEAIWCDSNSQSDSDTTLRESYRTSLTSCNDNGNSNFFVSLNNNSWELNNINSGGAGQGAPQLVAQQSANLTYRHGWRWHDDSLLTYEPLIGWGLTASTDESKLRGQLWDAAIINDGFTCDQTTAFDSRNWWVLTNQNTGSSLRSRGSLVLVVP